MTRLLILRTWSTHEYGGQLDLGVLDLTDAVCKTILNRHDAFVRLRRKDDALSSIAFHDEACRYIQADVDDLLEKLGCTAVFEENGWAVAPEGFYLPDFEFQRIEAARMDLDATSVSWSCCPRFEEVDVMTERIAVSRLRAIHAGKG